MIERKALPMTVQWRFLGCFLLLTTGCHINHGEKPYLPEPANEEEIFLPQNERIPEEPDNTIDWAKLKDPNPDIRMAGCQELSYLPRLQVVRRATPEISEALVEMLNDPVY